MKNSTNSIFNWKNVVRQNSKNGENVNINYKFKRLIRTDQRRKYHLLGFPKMFDLQ